MSSIQPDALFLEVQQALAGEYSLEREIGRGGMGVVYLAREVRLAREVALKVLPPEMAAADEQRERFVREAQMAARLSHPNIVTIHRVGEVGDIVYFAMTYVPGITLGEHLRQRGMFTPQNAVRMLREVAWALTYAHASGIVHRDVKPDNILLENGTGRTLVTDFGIAHSTATVDDLAGGGRVVGTSHYMSPEQAMGEPVDARSDIYSLGVVAYYAATGRLPYDGRTAQEVMAKHLSAPIPPVRAAAPGVPVRLAQAIECCLSKDPAHRFQKASDFADAIDQAIEVNREIPAPIRLWLSREEKSWAPRIMATIYGSAGLMSMVGAFTGSVVVALITIPITVSLILGLPTLINTRRVLKAGYTLDDLRAGVARNWMAKREELALVLSESFAITKKSAVIWTGVSVGAGSLAFLGDASFLRELPNAAGITFFTLLMGGLIGLVRILRRRRANAQQSFTVKLWSGKWGERLAGLASIRLKPVIAPQTLPQATEVALGRATDALFQALPKALKSQMAHIPATVRKLEADASALRDQIGKLESSIGSLDSDARQSRPNLADATELRADLRRLRDRSNEQLGTTVAALESIRLGLIRLQLGSGSVESVTAVLEAAHGAIRDIEGAADAQAEVERMLRHTQSLQPVLPPAIGSAS